MSKIILVTGGARSGKSVIAERLISQFGPGPIYIATAEARDNEMAARIAVHQARRGARWETVNAPLNLVTALHSTDNKGPRLVDCLTIWLSNVMLTDGDWQASSDTLAQTLTELSSPVILVTNEVGAGIVPENKLAREFRDAAGLLNQKIAAIADEVYLAVAGLSVQLKPGATSSCN